MNDNEGDSDSDDGARITFERRRSLVEPEATLRG